MGLFDKKQKQEEKKDTGSNESIFDIRRKISDLKKALDLKTKENERLKAENQKAENQKIQIKAKVRSQSKHIKRLKNKIERIEIEVAEIKAENTNLQTQARNSRERAKRFKDRVESS